MDSVAQRCCASAWQAGMDGMEEADVTQALVDLRGVRQVIEQTDSIELVKDVSNKAEALHKFLKLSNRAIEEQNKASEIRIWADRRLGELLQQMHLHGGNRRRRRHRSSTQSEYLNLEKTQSLENIGIDKNRSRRCQELARIPRAVFDEYFREAAIGKAEVAIAKLLRWAKRNTTVVTTPQLRTNGFHYSEISRISARLAALAGKGILFSCICIFPPWPRTRNVMREEYNERERSAFYLECKRLPLEPLIAAEAHVHLWTDAEHIEIANRLLMAWRLRARSVLVCQKPTSEYTGFWRTSHDFVLLAARGGLRFRDYGLESPYQLSACVDKNVSEICDLIARTNPGPYLAVFTKDCPNDWTSITG